MNTNPQEISRVFNLQKERFNAEPYMPVKERKTKLKKLLKAIIANQQAIEEAVYDDFRKPPTEVKLTEIFAVTSEIKLALRKLNDWTGREYKSAPLTYFGSSGWVMHEPKGIALIISPWNFPFLLALGPLVSAIAAGCRVILKPSEHSPNTSAFLKEFIGALFDESEAAVFLGDAEISKQLMEHPFNHIFFTGSTAVGKIIMEGAAKHLASVTLELGGKSPCIVERTANIKLAAERVVWGKFVNAGQTCIAPDYLMLEERIAERFLQHCMSEINKYSGADYCSIINQNHYNRLKHFIEDALNKGAEVLTGNEYNEEKRIIKPTILTNPNTEMEVMREEIFGPVLPVFTYETEDEIKAVIEQNPKPLALYIFSNSKKFTGRILKAIPAGTSAINDCVVHFANNNLPFGGVQTSGFGKSHGFYGFREFSNERAVMKQPIVTATGFLYPPYTKLKKKLAELTVKYF